MTLEELAEKLRGRFEEYGWHSDEWFEDGEWNDLLLPLLKEFTEGVRKETYIQCQEALAQAALNRRTFAPHLCVCGAIPAEAPK